MDIRQSNILKQRLCIKNLPKLERQIRAFVHRDENLKK